MNTEKKNESIETSTRLISSRADLELRCIYDKAYHEGQHDYRNKVKDFLIINPKMIESLNEMTNNPCKECEHAITMLKIECTNSQECQLKQNQLIALDILKHFKTDENLHTNS